LAVPYHLGIPGDTHTQVGRYEEARKALGEGLATSEKNDDRFEAAALHRLKEPKPGPDFGIDDRGRGDNERPEAHRGNR
jgi:hypothetical protein